MIYLRCLSIVYRECLIDECMLFLLALRLGGICTLRSSFCSKLCFNVCVAGKGVMGSPAQSFLTGIVIAVKESMLAAT